MMSICRLGWCPSYPQMFSLDLIVPGVYYYILSTRSELIYNILASSGPYRPLLARSGYPGQDASFYNNPMVMICATLTLLLTILCKFGQICATRNALMQLKTILCEFGHICATRNALMKLKTIVCKFWWICATKNALKQLKTILCKFWRICATKNALKQLENI